MVTCELKFEELNVLLGEKPLGLGIPSGKKVTCQNERS